jgi:hypothetical protein
MKPRKEDSAPASLDFLWSIYLETGKRAKREQISNNRSCMLAKASVCSFLAGWEGNMGCSS